MLGAASSLQGTKYGLRIATVASILAAALTLAALAPVAAHASGCTDTWTNTAGGNWFTASNWSKEAPPGPEDEACITAEGTYTVTMTQTSGTGAVTVRALTVGGTSGTQTLAVGSSCSLNAVFTTTAGLTTDAQGVVTLTNGDGCGDNVTLAGPITNGGLLSSEPEHGGSRSIQGAVTNTGTVAINATTAYNGTSTLFTNKGAIDIATERELTVPSKNSLTNGTAGSIVATGSGKVAIGSGATFTEGAGTTSGTKPVIVDDGTLDYAAGGGKSLIALHGSSALKGNLSAVQSLLVESTCAENVVATAGASFTNAGTITLTNGDGCGDNATLTISSGTLANSGKIITEPEHGGKRSLQGSITNTGTISIKAATQYNGKAASLVNEGALNLSEGTQLNVEEEGSVTNGSGGSISAAGTADVLMTAKTTYIAGAGATIGTKPVIVDDGTLSYAGGGKGPIALHGSSALNGSLGTEQALSIESTCSENAVATAAESFTNAGTITLTNGDGCGNNATLAISSGTLANSGKLVTEAAHGGKRTLQGSITNTATLSIKTPTEYNGTEAALINEGALNIAEGAGLTVSNKGSVTNGSGGSITSIAGADVFLGSGSTFVEGAGTTSGTKPVIVDDGTLDYTGTGTSAIALHGSSALKGSLGSEQRLTIESTCSENALTTAAEGFTNAGTITLTNGDGCGNNATLAISSGTLTNSGKVVTELEHGGHRVLQGNIDNTGSLLLKASTEFNGSSTLLTNTGTVNVSEGTQFSVSNGSSVTNGSGGNIVALGTASLFETGGTFTQASGKTSGTVPVIIDDGTLKYAGTSAEPGSGPIALRGSSSLSGRVRTSNALILQSTCSEHAVIAAAGSFENFGTIEMTNGDGCGNNVTLKLAGGTLTNGATLIVAEPHGGLRTIEGNFVNKATLLVAPKATLQVTGSFTQTSSGRYKAEIASASEYGSISVGGAATLAGIVAPRPLASFKASAGQTFAILTAASRSGAFASEAGQSQIEPGLYYKPVYSATGVSLVASHVTIALSESSGAPGSSITVTGGGYVPGDTVKIYLVKGKGVKTQIGSVTIGESGEYSTEVTIPATAAAGADTVRATSTLYPVNVSQPYTVT
jgi:hypothetical protein